MSAPATAAVNIQIRVPRSFLLWCATAEITFLSRPGLRRAVKMLLDFGSAALAVVVAIAVAEGVPTYSVAATALLASTAGFMLVAAQTVGGSYWTIWRYTSLREVIAVAVSTLVVAVTLALVGILAGLALTGETTLLIGLLMFLLSVGLRTMRRSQMAATQLSQRHSSLAAPPHSSRRVLIVGAGEHGLSIGRELTQNRNSAELIAYLDDDPTKIGAVLHGARVLGPLKELLSVCDTHGITEVIVAMPSATSPFIQALMRQLEDVGIRARAVHGVERFVTGEDVYRPGAATLHDLVGPAPALVADKAGTGGDTAARRVLVTGGAGFIGSHLVRMLLERGYHVRILDRFDYGRVGIEGLHHPNFEIVQGDICSARDVSRAVKSVHGVIALAAIVGDPACSIDPEETINLNYSATKILAETCHFYGVRRLVFASSCSVYGANSQAMLTEGSRLNAVSLYARTRVLSENILFDRHGDVEPVVMRLATVFGVSPRMRFDLVVNTLTACAVTDRRITIFGGNQWRPNVHCRDAARGLLLALEAPGSAVAGQTFNLGGDALNHRIHDLGETVARVVGEVAVEIRGEVADPRDYRVSFAKIRRVLGFEPERSVADGVREVASAVRSDPASRRWQEPIYHNVQELKRTLASPRRRRDDVLPARSLVHA